MHITNQIRSWPGFDRITSGYLEAGQGELYGYSMVWNEWGNNRRRDRRISFAPGCFGWFIAEYDTVLLMGGDSLYPLGRHAAGTLQLQEDDKGLFMRCQIPSWALHILESVERGDLIYQCLSFRPEEVERETREVGGEEVDHVRIIRAGLPVIATAAVPHFAATTLKGLLHWPGFIPLPKPNDEAEYGIQPRPLEE